MHTHSRAFNNPPIMISTTEDIELRLLVTSCSSTITLELLELYVQ